MQFISQLPARALLAGLWCPKRRRSESADMPELPEVEAQRRTIEAATVGKQIVTLVTLEQGGGPRDGLYDDKVRCGR